MRHSYVIVLPLQAKLSREIISKLWKRCYYGNWCFKTACYICSMFERYTINIQKKVIETDLDTLFQTAWTYIISENVLVLAVADHHHEGAYGKNYNQWCAEGGRNGPTAPGIQGWGNQRVKLQKLHFIKML